MKTEAIMAKNLEAGMYLVQRSERNKTRRVGKHICEFHLDRKGVTVRVNEDEGFSEHKFRRTETVRVIAGVRVDGSSRRKEARRRRRR